jgi:hypothetical protein
MIFAIVSLTRFKESSQIKQSKTDFAGRTLVQRGNLIVHEETLC